MFYSYDSLVARNGKFAIVWKLATSSNSRKKLVSRAAILGVSVPEMCESLISMVPSGIGAREELKSKFSLYLLSQLMYGVVVVLERQTIYLEIDIRAAYINAQNIHLNMPLEHEKQVTKKRKSIAGKAEEREKKGRKRKNEDDDSNYEIRNVPLNMSNLDKVGLALHDQITLNEPLPQPAFDQYFPIEDDLLPQTREQLEALHDIDMFPVVVERHSSSSSGEKQVIEREQLTSLNEKGFLSSMDELPPLDQFPPLEPFPALKEFGSLGDILYQPAPEVIDERNESRKLQKQAEELPVTINSSIYDLLPLDAQENAAPAPPSVKRRRPPLRLRDNITMISWEQIKLNLLDYSSTLRSLQDVIVKPREEPDINELFQPFPTWMRKPLNKELRSLYKPCIGQKLTYEEAAEVDPNVPPTRGPENELWRYEGSSEEPSTKREFPMLDDDLRPISIGFIHSTPEMTKKINEESMNIEEEQRFIPNLSDVEYMDVGNPSSVIEDQRRSNVGHLTADENTRKSTLLLHSDREPESSYGMACVLGEDFAEKQASLARAIKTKKMIMRSLQDAGGAHCSFNALFPTEMATRKQAAWGFSSLLELLKSQLITVQQDEPYSEIWIEAIKNQPSTWETSDNPAKY